MRDTSTLQNIQPNMSFGMEIEWSDTDRSIDIPVELGKWEGPKIAGYYMGSEIDIVNTKGKWKGIGSDPLAIECPVGGEINTQPSFSPETQLHRVMEIMELFPTVGTGCVNEGHIHVHIPGLKDNLDLLKNVFRYVIANEEDTLKNVFSWDKITHSQVWSSELKLWVKTYLQFDAGKSLGITLEQVEKADSVEELLLLLTRIHALNKCWITGEIQETTSRRTAINLFNLTKGETVEFRCFRSSINPVEIYSSLVFVKRFMEEAIKGDFGKPVIEILKEGNFRFPTLDFNLQDALGWQKTRQTKGRGGPFKKYTGTTIPHDERYADMWVIVELCKRDLNLQVI